MNAANYDVSNLSANQAKPNVKKMPSETQTAFCQIYLLIHSVKLRLNAINCSFFALAFPESIASRAASTPSANEPTTLPA